MVNNRDSKRSAALTNHPTVNGDKHNDVVMSSNSRNGTNSNSNEDEKEAKNIVDNNEKDAFQQLLREAFQTIIQSDIQRGEFSGNSDGSSSQGRWLYDPAARKLQALMDRLVIHVSFDLAALHDCWMMFV